MRGLVLAAVAMAAVLGAAGCGTGGLTEKGDATTGKTLFQQKCGRCHVLADAGTLGTTGPNLDDAFAALRTPGRGGEDERFRQNTIQQVVADQIKFAIAPMPNADELFPRCKGSQKTPECSDDPERDIADISTYVAEKAGIGGPVAAPAGGGGQQGGQQAGGGTTTAEAAPGNGQALFASLGCQGCHTVNGQKSTGPTLKGLFGSKVELTDGTTVTADERYLLASILDPDKEIVQGFAKGVMSSVIKPGQVSQADAKALVDYIKSLK